MKKILLSLTAVFVMALTMVSCSSNSPKAAAEKWLNSFYHLDYEAAKSVSTEATKQQLDMMGQLMGMMPDSAKEQAKKIKIEVKDVKEEGDKATVTYTMTDEKGTAAPGTQTLNMQKENGKWLAAWNKQDQMGGGSNGMENTTEPVTPPTNDTMMAPPAEGTAPATTDTATH